jgi:hypothetical protein
VPLADIRPALRAFLLANPTVTAAVGGERIFPVVMPQGERRTSLVINTISETTDHHTQGSSGMVMARCQLDVYAPNPDDADTLARAVKLRIDGFAGLMPYGENSPQDSVQVQGIFSETARTDYQAEPELVRVSRDFLIWYAEK